jgi:hypothetical protein
MPSVRGGHLRRAVELDGEPYLGPRGVDVQGAVAERDLVLQRRSGKSRGEQGAQSKGLEVALCSCAGVGEQVAEGHQTRERRHGGDLALDVVHRRSSLSRGSEDSAAVRPEAVVHRHGHVEPEPRAADQAVRDERAGVAEHAARVAGRGVRAHGPFIGPLRKRHPPRVEADEPTARDPALDRPR